MQKNANVAKIEYFEGLSLCITLHLLCTQFPQYASPNHPTIKDLYGAQIATNKI